MVKTIKPFWAVIITSIVFASIHFIRNKTDGIIDENEMRLVKQALATSSDRSNFESDTHNSHSGYGSLDLVEWSKEVAFSFNVA